MHSKVAIGHTGSAAGRDGADWGRDYRVSHGSAFRLPVHSIRGSGPRWAFDLDSFDHTPGRDTRPFPLPDLLALAAENHGAAGVAAAQTRVLARILPAPPFLALLFPLKPACPSPKPSA